jgi:hypothetical protein
MPRVSVYEPIEEKRILQTIFFFARKQLNEMRDDFHNEDLLSLLS